MTLNDGAQDSYCHSLKELVIRIEERVENVERRQQLMDRKHDKLFTFSREGAENGQSTVVKKDVDEYFVVGSSILCNSM